MAGKFMRSAFAAVFLFHSVVSIRASDDVVGQLLGYIGQSFQVLDRSPDGHVIQLKVVDQCDAKLYCSCAFFSLFNAATMIQAFQAPSVDQGKAALQDIFSETKIFDTYNRWNKVLEALPGQSALPLANAVGWKVRCDLLKHESQLQVLVQNKTLIHESSLLMNYTMLHKVSDIWAYWHLDDVKASMNAFKQASSDVRAFIMADECHAYCMVVVKYRGELITFILDSINRQHRIEMDKKYIDFFHQCIASDDLVMTYLQECFCGLIEQSDIFIKHHGLKTWADNKLASGVVDRQGWNAGLWYHTLELVDSFRRRKDIKASCPGLVTWAKAKLDQLRSENPGYAPTGEFARIVALVT